MDALQRLFDRLVGVHAGPRSEHHRPRFEAQDPRVAGLERPACWRRAARYGTRRSASN